jgi:hypothetical protein
MLKKFAILNEWAGLEVAPSANTMLKSLWLVGWDIVPYLMMSCWHDPGRGLFSRSLTQSILFYRRWMTTTQMSFAVIHASPSVNIPVRLLL